MAEHLPAPDARRIALIAHDNKKQDMLEWARYNLARLTEHQPFSRHTDLFQGARRRAGRPFP